jgi:hypothetical protein
MLLNVVTFFTKFHRWNYGVFCVYTTYTHLLNIHNIKIHSSTHYKYTTSYILRFFEPNFVGKAFFSTANHILRHCLKTSRRSSLQQSCSTTEYANRPFLI